MHCPVCGSKTRDKIGEGTLLKNYPLFLLTLSNFPVKMKAFTCMEVMTWTKQARRLLMLQ
ncbi:MAG: hypothetical protein HFI70_09690 [Lachnospiraceae bacterium]|nr:hypothetical protein [Lachnospiraceae bacterium]